MTLSVLISVYYKEKPEYLHRALESIWDNQTFCRYLGTIDE